MYNLKRYWYTVCVAVILLLSGCGAGDGNPASEKAVSGQTAEVRSGGSRYTYCSDRKLYYIENCYADDAVLIEMDRENGTQRKLLIPQLHQVCYADNSWVYYTTKEYDGEGLSVVKKVWRIPVDKASFQADETAAETVLESEDESGFVPARSHVGCDYRGVLCDGKYIVYCEDGKKEGIRIYNIGTEAYRDIAKEDVDVTIENMVLRNGNLVFFDDVAEKLCCIHLGEKTEAVMTTKENDDIDESGVTFPMGTATDEDVFWSTGIGRENGKKNGGIWQYHFADDSSVCLISEEEIKNILKKEGVSECSCDGEGQKWYEDGIFVSRERLYVQIMIEGKRNRDVSCRHCLIVSKAIGKPEDNLKSEKELNRWLANPKERQKIFVKKQDGIYGKQPHSEKSVFMNRGFVMAMTDDACLMCLENADEKKNSLACYYFDKKKKSGFVTAKDANGLLYLYDRENTIVTGDVGQFAEYLDIEGRLPNNYGVESMKKQGKVILE